MDKWYYNLKPFRGRRDVVEKDEVKYTIRLCDTPHNTTGEDEEDVVVIRSEGGKSNYVITLNSLDYRPMDSGNFKQGLVYFGNGEPYRDINNNWRTLDIEWRIHCGNETSENVSITYDIFDSGNSTGFIYGSMTSFYGCPMEQLNTPTPTPEYEPNCGYRDRNPVEYETGIIMDFKDLNDGPYGIKTKVTVGGVERTLYYQPCERMTCPPLFTCPDEELFSSAWLCDFGTFECDSYGVGVTQPRIDPLDPDGDLSKGLTLSIENSNRSTILYLQCEPTFPEGHIQWGQIGELNETSQELLLYGKTQSVCLIPFPEPTTPPPGGQCSFQATIDPETLSINIAKSNKDYGWRQMVTVYGEGLPNSMIVYQPCGGTTCPGNAYCSGDEDASVWLCTELEGETFCYGYGLWENNVSLELYDPLDLKFGIKATYTGDLRRRAVVRWMCNQSLGTGELLLESYVTMQFEELTMVVQSSDVCQLNMYWVPDKPEKPESTPTPSPGVPEFEEHNATHQIKFDLEEIAEEDEYATVVIAQSNHYVNRTAGQIWWNIWHMVPITGSGIASSANMWLCWTDLESSNYCHPVADRELGLEKSLLKEDNLDGGVLLHYRGYYGFDLKVEIKCELDGPDNFSIPQGSTVWYTSNEEETYVTVSLVSSLVCPQPIESSSATVPPTSEPTSEPTVEPTSEPTVEPTSEPTVEPTSEPTAEPTSVPTSIPTASATPSISPTPSRSPSPSPGPIFYPTPVPKPSDPTPKPLISPNPLDIINSDTTYIIAELDQLHQTVTDRTVKVIYAKIDSYVDATLIYHPWDLQECPEWPNFKQCADHRREANIWLCWGEPRYCHAVGDKRISNSLTAIDDHDYSKGAYLNYGGVYGFDTTIVVNCNASDSSKQIAVRDDTTYYWAESGENVTLGIILFSGMLCPHEFEQAWKPSAGTPTPTPDPKLKVQLSDEWIDDDHDYISLDLHDLGSYEGWVAAGDGTSYSRVYFAYHPVDPQPAPSIADEIIDLSGESTRSNIWRCVNISNKVSCHTIGSNKFGIDWEVINGDADHGMALQYSGGVGGSSIEVRFQCNESVPDGEIFIDPIVSWGVEGEHMAVVNTHTAMVCKNLRSDHFAGAVFMSVVLLGFVFYVAGGIWIAFIRNGRPMFPNDNFWSEVCAVIVGLFTCDFTGKQGEYQAM